MADKTEVSDEELSAYAEEQEAHSEAIRELVFDYLDNQDVDESTAVFTLLEMSLSISMAAYADSTEKPSIGGLRLELDRVNRDIQDMIREAKKNAGEFIEAAKAARDDAEAADED